MTIRAQTVAKAIKAWAQENHLMRSEFPVELEGDQEERDRLVDSLGISAQSERIFRSRGITGVGFNGAENEVVVFTQKSVPLKELKNLPVEVQESVKITYMQGGLAQTGGPMPAPAAPYFMHNGRYCCGGSIHPARYIGAGTLGALVRDAAGNLFGLTNNHVSGMCNYSLQGEKILAPGHLDISAAGIDPFTIGYHARALPMVAGVPDNVDISQNRDAALIAIPEPNSVSSMQGVYFDTPLNVVALQANQSVLKVGRTTGLTAGVVRAEMVGPHPVMASVPGGGQMLFFFEPVFAITGVGGLPFSQGGDSGSLICAELNNERYAAGLLFAGDQQGTTFALPLDAIMANLNVSLISNHNL